MRTLTMHLFSLICCITISAMEENKRLKLTDDLETTTAGLKQLVILDSSQGYGSSGNLDTITKHMKHLTLELAAHDGRLPSEWSNNSDMTKELLKSIMAAYEATPEGRVHAGKDLSNLSVTCKKNHAVLSDSKLCENLLAWDRTRSAETFKPELAGYYYAVPGMRKYIKHLIIEAKKSRNDLVTSFINALKISSARQRIQEGILHVSKQLYEDPARMLFMALMLKSGQPIKTIIEGIKAIDGNLKFFIPLQKAHQELTRAYNAIAAAIEDPEVKQLWLNDWIQVAPGMYRSISEQEIPQGVPALNVGPGKVLRYMTITTQEQKDDMVYFEMARDGAPLFIRLNTKDNDFIGNGIPFRRNTTDYMLMPACNSGDQRTIDLFDLTNMVTKSIVSEDVSLTGSFKLIGDRLFCPGVEKQKDGTVTSVLLDWDPSEDTYSIITLAEKNPDACSVLAVSQRQTLLMGNVASGVRMEYDPKTKQCKEVITNLKLVHNYDQQSRVSQDMVIDNQ